MKWLRCLLALALTLCLTACGAPEKKDDPSASGVFVPALDKDTACTIQVVGHYDNFEALVSEFNLFNQYYPNVTLKYVKLDDYNKSIVTALTGGEAPDIFFAYPSMVIAKETYQGLFDAAEDLSDKALGIDLGCIRPGLLYKDEQGHVPFVPIFSETYGMLVNEDLFKKENVQIPRTYSQLTQACEQLQKAGYASPMMGYNRGTFLLYPMLHPYFCAQIRDNRAALDALNAMKPEAGEYMRSTLEKAVDFMNRGFIDLEACNTLEKDYDPVILRFFEGDVPMMLAKAGTVSGTEKRESRSEAFTAHPFKYSFWPVPSTEEGSYFLDVISLYFGVNRNSKNLAMANEFMRFLVTTAELNRMAKAKRMVTPCSDMSLDGVYAAFGELDPSRVIYQTELGLQDAPDVYVRDACWQVSNGLVTVDEAVAGFGRKE